MKLTIGFSPCPNDTFIFDAMVNNKIDTQGITFEAVLEDVETLNNWAKKGRLDITKLSYSTFLHTVNQYALLHSGSALGKGVGPLLIAKEHIDLNKIENYKIAIPGINTTANLLLSLAFPKAAHKEELVFSDIEAAVINGDYDAGLIIHENRFTYQQKGLVKLIDLGDWWEQNMHAAIPLGGIVIKREIDSLLSKKVDDIIKASLAYSWNNYPSLSSYIRDHAQEMEEDVMRKHIELYVNNYTTDLGTEGAHAINTLFKQAALTNIITEMSDQLFYSSTS